MHLHDRRNQFLRKLTTALLLKSATVTKFITVTLFLTVSLNNLIKCQSFEPVAPGTPTDQLQPQSISALQSSATATTVINDKCQSVDTPFCNIPGHTTSVNPFINSFNHTLSTAIIELNKYVFLLARQPCGMKIKLFLCSLYAPVCVPQEIPDKLLLPCRDDCEEAQRVCTSDLHAANMTWPEEWSCSKFKYSKHDPLCVINNNSSNELNQQQSDVYNNNGPLIGLGTANGSLDGPSNAGKHPIQPYIYVQSNNSDSSNKTLCSPDMFDCRITDQTEAQKAVCIQQDFVCDSKHDCPRNSDGIGLDEVGCTNYCSNEEFYCDFRCISTSRRCDGKTDCSDGNDELNCAENSPFESQFDKYAVICLMALAIFLFIQCIKKLRCDDKTDVVDMCSENQVVGICPSANVVGDLCSSRIIPTERDKDIVDRVPSADTNHKKLYPRLPTPPYGRPNVSNHINPIMTNYDVPIYQEPSTVTSVDECSAEWPVGCYSGAASVYASTVYAPAVSSSSVYTPATSNSLVYASYDIDDQPAAPPPTPHPQYS